MTSLPGQSGGIGAVLAADQDATPAQRDAAVGGWAARSSSSPS